MSALPCLVVAVDETATILAPRQLHVQRGDANQTASVALEARMSQSWTAR
jgi:hypothetical protein